MRKFSKEAATLVGETLTELQCDGSSSYVCGGGQTFKLRTSVFRGL